MGGPRPSYAFYDTRLVRRTNWLLADMGEDPYGRKFNYSEHLLFPTEESAKEVASSNTSSKKEEEKLKSEGRLYELGDGLDDETRMKLFTDYYLHVTAEDGGNNSLQGLRRRRIRRDRAAVRGDDPASRHRADALPFSGRSSHPPSPAGKSSSRP